MSVTILILLLKGGEVGIIWEPSKKAVLLKDCAMVVSCKLLTMEALV
jgi:hypothetical protein